MKRHQIIQALRKYTSHKHLAMMLGWSDFTLERLLAFYENRIMLRPRKTFIGIDTAFGRDHTVIAHIDFDECRIEKLREEADDRDRDIAEGWQPAH